MRPLGNTLDLEMSSCFLTICALKAKLAQKSSPNFLSLFSLPLEKLSIYLVKCYESYPHFMAFLSLFMCR